MVPANVQMVFVPFISFVIIMPLTAFLIGPLSIWIGNGLGGGLAWLNGNAPILFAIIIPIIYPFLVPLGLHWPLNALQLANIAATGSDFIQGPMGAWNFACFGATAGVLFLSIRDRDSDMRQTASGALAAGLFGGISEPSLYGIHLRFKRIYPLMLTGCVAGGLVIGIGGGAITHTFVFTSLLTIPVFSPTALYGLGIAVAFFTAFLMVVIFDYRTKEQRAEARERKAALKAGVTPAQAAAPGAPVAPAPSAPVSSAAPEFSAEAVADLTLTSPLEGQLVALSDVADEAFSAGALGPGIAVSPSGGAVVAPCDGKVSVAFPTGHAYGIKSASGIQVLIHIGMDTVKLEGKGFTPRVAKGDVVRRGDVLAEVDWDVIREAGYDTITPMVVTNKKKFGEVSPAQPGPVAPGDTVVTVSPMEACADSLSLPVGGADQAARPHLHRGSRGTASSPSALARALATARTRSAKGWRTLTRPLATAPGTSRSVPGSASRAPALQGATASTVGRYFRHCAACWHRSVRHFESPGGSRPQRSPNSRHWSTA